MLLQIVRLARKILSALAFGLLLATCTATPTPILFPTTQITTPLASPTTTSNPPTAGILDSSFGRGGIVITGPLYGGPTLAIQSDGRIVTAGTAPSSSIPIPGRYSGLVLQRYNLDGSPDSTFGNSGTVITESSTEAGASAVAIQSDGRIVVVGTVERHDFALARYFADGSQDPTFGTRGIVVTNLSGGNDWAQAVALQPDGKIIVAGHSLGSPQHQNNLALARYNPDGSLDDTFGDRGKVFADMNGTGDAWALVVQSDGKIVAVGSGSSQVRMFNFAVLRYDTNGELDATFGKDGIALSNWGGDAEGMAVALQSDGKIVAAGQARYHNSGGFVVARYNTDGSLDSSFGEAGVVISNLAGAGWARGVALQPDGKIVAAGGTGKDAYSSAFAVLRYNTNGTLDRSFAGSGQIITAIGGNAIPTAMGLEPDGKIVVAGYTISYLTAVPGGEKTSSESSLIVRYLP